MYVTFSFLDVIRSSITFDSTQQLIKVRVIAA